MPPTVRSLTRNLVGPLTRNVSEVRGFSSLLRFLSPSYFRGNTADAPLAIATYDGGNEVVHPSVVYRQEGWNGYKYWMALTPYAGSSSAIENPSIYVSNDGDTWAPPPGLTNPLDIPASGFNADPELVFGHDGYLYCFYKYSAGTTVDIVYRRSADGVVWGDKVVVLSYQLAVKSLASPAILWDGAKWVMWVNSYLSSPDVVIRFTAPAITGPWTEEATCVVPMITNRDPWHLSMSKIDGLYAMWVSDSALGATSAGDLFLLFSTDGINFTRSTYSPLIHDSSWHFQFYRSSALPVRTGDKVQFDLFYTGRSAAGNWKIGRTTVNWRDVGAESFFPSLAMTKTASYIGGDLFSRPDGALGTSDSGTVWTVVSGSPVIISEASTVSADTNSISVLETGVADGYFEMEVSSHASGGQTFLVFRYSDANNRWRVGYRSDNEVLLQKTAGGSTTTFGIMPSVYPGERGYPAIAKVGVECAGSTLTFYINGCKVYTITDAFNATATKMGLQIDRTASRVTSIWGKSGSAPY